MTRPDAVPCRVSADTVESSTPWQADEADEADA